MFRSNVKKSCSRQSEKKADLHLSRLPCTGRFDIGSEPVVFNALLVGRASSCTLTIAMLVEFCSVVEFVDVKKGQGEILSKEWGWR